MLLDEVRAVRRGEVGCQTLVVDTADAAESLCKAQVLATNKWPSIETPGYGKGLREPLGSPYSRMWLSDALPRRIDFLSLLSMCDTFFARIFHVRGEIVPIGTVTMTTMFHADAADLAAEDTTVVLGAADARSFHKSFSDQTDELWSPGGRLLATTSQTVYFKA